MALHYVGDGVHVAGVSVHVYQHDPASLVTDCALNLVGVHVQCDGVDIYNHRDQSVLDQRPNSC